MTINNDGETVTIRHTRADGSEQVFKSQVKPGETITATREDSKGHRDERQIYPQVTPWKPVGPKSPFKESNDK